MFKTKIIDEQFLHEYLDAYGFPATIKGEFVAISLDNLGEKQKELLINLAHLTLFEICRLHDKSGCLLELSHEYFLIKYEYLLYMILCEKIENQDYNEYLLVAIDGNCCAGKTTLAKILGDFFEATVIHMDDYFLPKERYTEDLQDEIGGNIDINRLKEEVLDNDEVVINRFDCKTQTYHHEKTVAKKGVIVIEGTFSLLEAVSRHIDYAVILTISSPDQKIRLIQRESGDMVEEFETKWLPQERKYLNLLDYAKVNFYINSKNIDKETE